LSRPRIVVLRPVMNRSHWILIERIKRQHHSEWPEGELCDGPYSFSTKIEERRQPRFSATPSIRCEDVGEELW
jgi:hypothetical protein